MIQLARYYTPLDKGTFGILDAYGLTFYTVELPWRKNRANVSCIPEGTYKLQREMFYGGDGPGGRPDYETFGLAGVVGRTFIKLHVANTAGELQGCIGIGNALGVANGHWAVLHSREAHKTLMRVMGDDRQEDLIRIYQARGET